MQKHRSDRYFEFLATAYLEHNSYHNHKETMAWVFTALYVPGIIALGFALKGTNTPLDSPSYWFIAVFVVAWFLATAFVCKQLRLRSGAADTNLAIKMILNRLCIDPDWDPVNVEIEQDHLWPDYIQSEIDSLKGKGRPLRDTVFTDYPLILAIALSSVIAGIITYI